ncbi:MAG: hypothetical protein M3O24_02660 [Thermoproteota archaeon]|nr:hypothetical protein [Thermoproteota archaeon]
MITIDISRLPSHLRSLILKEVEINIKDAAVPEDIGNYTTDSNTDPHVKNDVNVITLTSDSNINEVKQRLKDTLIENKVSDYVVMIDLEEQNRIIILKKEHAKTLGVYHCLHCGMEFENEIHFVVHQRIHYML